MLECDIGVSVCVFTYNYEKYLSEALESILMQKTSFPIEIIIGDDFSTDLTRDICTSYSHQYPDLIRLNFSDGNKGGTLNWINTINKCKGKYIALLDGDDYFSDHLKLQKQYDALENDPTSCLCFHAVEEKYDDIIGFDKEIHFEKSLFTLKDFMSRGWFIRTGSTFFRNGILPSEPPAWVYEFPYRYDTIIHVFLGLKGSTIYIDDVMSVWRKHQKGMSKSLLENTRKNISKEIELAWKLNEYTENKYLAEVAHFCSKEYFYLTLHLIKTRQFLKYPKLFIYSLCKANFSEFVKSITLYFNK